MFDWVTWSVWGIGAIITIVWIIVPFEEFIGIVKAQHAKYKDRVAAEREAAAEEKK